jgi:putative transposase
MTRPYSEDIRERALARADAGETVRSIAEALQISPSCVTKWKNLRRDTGGLSPGKIGGHKRPVLSGANADWLRKRIRSGPFTLRKLTRELAARGIKTDVRAVWTFVRRRAELQKKRFCRPSKTAPISLVNGHAGRRIKAG